MPQTQPNFEPLTVIVKELIGCKLKCTCEPRPSINLLANWLAAD